MRRIIEWRAPAHGGEAGSMVFSKIVYGHRSLLCRAAGIAADLVAPQDNAGMEDRAYIGDHLSQLDFDSSHG